MMKPKLFLNCRNIRPYILLCIIFDQIYIKQNYSFLLSITLYSVEDMIKQRLTLDLPYQNVPSVSSYMGILVLLVRTIYDYTHKYKIFSTEQIAAILDSGYFLIILYFKW